MLSTSRVYSIAPLAGLPVRIENDAYHPNFDSYAVVGLSGQGVSEKFSTTTPLSLYGATKLASEVLALEYADAFQLPVWINRCGVLAGPGQFGKPDQGIFAFWINSYLRRRPLRYIGFDGRGLQVRDCLHPRDVAALAWKQMQSPVRPVEQVQNVGGGIASAMSLAQLTAWCAARFGKHPIESDSSPRRYDIPWLVLDATKANQQWDWRPTVPVEQILEQIAQHAEAHPRLEQAANEHQTHIRPLPLQLLSVVIPARDEEGCIASTVEHLTSNCDYIMSRMRSSWSTMEQRQDLEPYATPRCCPSSIQSKTRASTVSAGDRSRPRCNER